MFKLVLYHVFLILLLLLALPLMVAVALSIFVSNGWPIIFLQKRVGFRGKIFNIYKFRTMIKNADSYKNKLKLQNEADGPVFKIFNDPRYTNIGKFLSHTGLDELPQLLNILKGEMSLFGPRPLPIEEHQQLSTSQKARQLGKPGIVSPWVLTTKYHEDFYGWMKSDLDYLKKKSVLVDCWLFWQTLMLLFWLTRAEIMRLGNRQRIQ